MMAFSTEDLYGSGVLCGKNSTQYESLSPCCLGDIDVVAPIMVHQGTKIPTFHSMGCPRASHSRIFMDDDLCARRGERCGVVVELYMQLCIPEKFWVHARLSEQVERENGM